jgi:NAD(P)-dependent dehydrogenase (short-subunit alcohol dehydrogenase family)
MQPASKPDGRARAVLVTGAARGLARGVAASLAAAGYRVAFTFRAGGTSPDETLAAIVAAGGAPGLALDADHGVAGSTADAVARAEEALGGLDAVVHAVGPIVVRSFQRSSLDDYAAMVDGNLRSAVEAAFAALPGMRARGYGRLIFFGMNGSHATLPARGMTLYGAAKAGVVAFARALALEEAKYGISVNVIEPGDIRDKAADRAAARALKASNPTEHAGSWEDIAAAVRFLLDADNGYLNGVTLGVNGGLAEPYET